MHRKKKKLKHSLLTNSDKNRNTSHYIFTSYTGTEPGKIRYWKYAIASEEHHQLVQNDQYFLGPGEVHPGRPPLLLALGRAFQPF